MLFDFEAGDLLHPNPHFLYVFSADACPPASFSLCSLSTLTFNALCIFFKCYSSFCLKAFLFCSSLMILHLLLPKQHTIFYRGHCEDFPDTCQYMSVSKQIGRASSSSCGFLCHSFRTAGWYVGVSRTRLWSDFPSETEHTVYMHTLHLHTGDKWFCSLW